MRTIIKKKVMKRSRIRNRVVTIKTKRRRRRETRKRRRLKMIHKQRIIKRLKRKINRAVVHKKSNKHRAIRKMKMI